MNPLQYDKPQTHMSRATGTGGPFAGSGVVMSCALCHTHRPIAALVAIKGSKLRKCADRQRCNLNRNKP